MQLSKREITILNCICNATQRHFRQKVQSKWTNIIKDALWKSGEKLGYRVYPSGRRREWLYDLCWADEGKSWKDFRGLKLIAEIEWKKGKDKDHSDSILEDFQKLTVGNADHRLLVIGYNEKSRIYNEDWLNKVIERCRKTCCNSGKNFRYFIIALPEQEKENIKRYIIDKGEIHTLGGKFRRHKT